MTAAVPQASVPTILVMILATVLPVAAAPASVEQCAATTVDAAARIKCLVAASATGGGGSDRKKVHLALGDALFDAGKFERAAKVFRAAAVRHTSPAPPAVPPPPPPQPPRPWALGNVNPIRRWINEYANRDALVPQPRVQKWEEYLDAYHRHFAKFRGTAANVLEIGVQSGGSLLMWREYFGPKAHIYGVDIDPRALHFHAPEQHVHVLIGDQGDEAFLASLCDTIGRVDVVLDDGSHYNEHQVQLFEALFTRGRCLNMKEGVFVVEDVTTSYMPQFGGGLRAPASFIEFAKAKVDELNAFWSSPTANVCKGLADPDAVVDERNQAIGDTCAVRPTLFTGAAASVVFYSGMVVFEMNPRGERRDAPTRLPNSVDVGSLKVPKWYWWAKGGDNLREKFAMPEPMRHVFNNDVFKYNKKGVLSGTRYSVNFVHGEERKEGEAHTLTFAEAADGEN